MPGSNDLVKGCKPKNGSTIAEKYGPLVILGGMLVVLVGGLAGFLDVSGAYLDAGVKALFAAGGFLVHKLARNAHLAG
jgi:hypothetical protein